MGRLTNLNPPAPIADGDLPPSIARDTEITAAFSAHEQATNPHPQYLPANLVGLEFGSGEVNYIDFHTGAIYKDFDIRLIGSGGGATSGLGTLLLQAALFQINSKLSINGGAQIVRFLSSPVAIDPPLINGGSIWQANQNISGAVQGDLALFAFTQVSANLPLFNIQSVISAAGVASLYFHNLSSSAIDLPTVTGRLVVLGF